MQNKPNFQNAQMNVNISAKMSYEYKSNWTLGENKPNSNPNKPNCRKSKIDAKCVFTKDYEKNADMGYEKTKPIQTQFKPKQTQFYIPPGEPALLALRSFSEGGSAAEGGLAMIFLGAFLQRVAARPEKNVGTMNLLAIKSYRFCLNYVLLLSN